MSENDASQNAQGKTVGQEASRTGFEYEGQSTMLVSRGRPSQWSRTLRFLVATALAVMISGSMVEILAWELAPGARASTLSRAGGDIDHSGEYAEAELVSFTVDALPPRETYVALQRIRYLPGAHLAEQPSDGPKLLAVLSGVLTILVPVSGVVVTHPPAEGAITSSVKPGVVQSVNPGTVVMIPAGIPAQLSNTSERAAEWIQFQVETPATLCACGEDRTAVEMELLSSQTLPGPILPPTIVSLTRQPLDPAAEISSPSSGTIQLIGAVDNDESLLLGDDGSARNDGREPIEVVVATIASVDATD